MIQANPSNDARCGERSARLFKTPPVRVSGRRDMVDGTVLASRHLIVRRHASLGAYRDCEQN
jgi:hypothetical protein